MAEGATVQLADPNADRPAPWSLLAIAIPALCVGLAAASWTRPAPVDIHGGAGHEAGTMPAHGAVDAGARGEPVPERGREPEPEFEKEAAPEAAAAPEAEAEAEAAPEAGTVPATAGALDGSGAPLKGSELGIPPAPKLVPSRQPRSRMALPDMAANASPAQTFKRGHVAYVRCDGLEQHDARFPCPRDRMLEQRVWSLLRGRVPGCTSGDGRVDVRLEFGPQAAPEVRISIDDGNATSGDVERCVREGLLATQTSLTPDRMIVSFRFTLERSSDDLAPIVDSGQ